MRFDFVQIGKRYGAEVLAEFYRRITCRLKGVFSGIHIKTSNPCKQLTYRDLMF